MALAAVIAAVAALWPEIAAGAAAGGAGAGAGAALGAGAAGAGALGAGEALGGAGLMSGAGAAGAGAGPLGAATTPAGAAIDAASVGTSMPPASMGVQSGSSSMLPEWLQSYMKDTGTNMAKNPLSTGLNAKSLLGGGGGSKTAAARQPGPLPKAQPGPISSAPYMEGLKQYSMEPGPLGGSGGSSSGNKMSPEILAMIQMLSKRR